MPPKYIRFYIMPGRARMRKGVYRGTVEHNFIRMVVPLIIIRRENRTYWFGYLKQAHAYFLTQLQL